MSWYYCLVHQRVEPEDGCANAERLGPYATEAEAQHALETAKARNDAFDAARTDRTYPRHEKARTDRCGPSHVPLGTPAL